MELAIPKALEAARRRAPARRRRGPGRGAAAAGLALAAMSAVLWIAGGPAHASGRPAEAAAWIVGGTAALALAATALALPQRGSMLPRARGVLLAVIAGVPAAVGLWITAWHGAYADPFVRAGLRCFLLTALTAPWPFAALVALRGRPDPVHPGWSGAGLGAAAGAWAAVMVELWCPLATPDHVALGHVAPLALLAAAGAAAGRSLFRLPEGSP